MLLSKDQINRYMRHIAMPEVSGPGQKKILDSSVVFFSENPAEASLALYYIAASGVGNLYCRFSDAAGWEMLAQNLTDLNSDVNISLLDEGGPKTSEGQALTVIIAGNSGFVKSSLQDIIQAHNAEYNVPIIVALHRGWKGIIRILDSYAAVEEFMAGLNIAAVGSSYVSGFPDKLSGYFSCLIAVIEHLKLALSRGKPLTDGLHFDLSTMEFDFPCCPADAFIKLMYPGAAENNSKALADSRVLIIGCGGLGSPAAFALAASGIGSLGLVDFDTVEISNLNRQIMHSTSRIGMSKVKSAEAFLSRINPETRLELHNVRISKGNVRDIISSYDIVIGGLDNLPSRYILNDACYADRKPLIEAGALDISGLATTIIPGEGHCYRCIFPETSENDALPSCSETGVLGPVPGVMGIIQAAEVVKLLTGVGDTLKDRILLFDVFDTDIFVAAHGKNKYCDLCGNK